MGGESSRHYVNLALVYINEEINCHRTGLEHQYGRHLIVFFIVWDAKMAHVTSCEIQSFCTGVLLKREGLTVRLRASHDSFLFPTSN